MTANSCAIVTGIKTDAEMSTDGFVNHNVRSASLTYILEVAKK